MKTSEILRGIAQKIEEKGWFGSGNRSDNSTCVMLAAGHVYRVTHPLATRIIAALGIKETYNPGFGASSPYGSVVAWNDSQPDGATVIAALRSAADKAEQEEGGQG